MEYRGRVGHETPPCDAVVTDTRHQALAQAQRLYTRRSEPSWEGWALGVLMYPCGLVDGNPGTALAQGLLVWEAMHMWVRVIWEISVPSSQFCCEPITTLKN